MTQKCKKESAKVFNNNLVFLLEHSDKNKFIYFLITLRNKKYQKKCKFIGLIFFLGVKMSKTS